jgi:hypothetical protein
MAPAPNEPVPAGDAPADEYDPDLTEHLLEEGGKALAESRRLLDDMDRRLDDGS